VDTIHAGSIWVHAVEPIVRGQDTICWIRTRQPLDTTILAAAMEKQAAERPALALRWQRSRDGRRFEWVPPSNAEHRALLAANLERCRTKRPDFGSFMKSEDRLPMMLLPWDDRTLLCRMSHLFTNALGQAYWLEDLLRCSTGEPPPLHSGRDPQALGGALRSLLAVGRALRFVASFRSKAGRDSASTTADLTDGRLVEQHRRGMTLGRALLPERTASELRAHARQRGLTWTERVASALIRAIRTQRPAATRVLLGLPVDLLRHYPKRSRFAPGNPTAGHLLQHLPGEEVDEAVRLGMAPARRGVPFGLARMMDAPARDEGKLLDELRQRALLPICKRAPFENSSSLLSSVPIPDALSALGDYAESLSFHSFSQFLIVSTTTVGGRTTIGFTSPDDLIDRTVAVAVVEAVLRDLVPSDTPPLELITIPHE